MLALVTHGRSRSPVLCGPRRMGAAAPAAASFATVGISAGVSLAEDAIGQWIGAARLRGGQKIATTEIANEFASQMGALNKAYFSAPPSCANQRTALDAFDQALTFLQSPQGCGNMGYGSAGERCISERVAGGKYDAVRANRDPMANDPRLVGAGCDVSQQVIVPTTTGQLTSVQFSTGSTAPGSTAPGFAALPAISSSSSFVPLLLGGLLLYLVAK